MTWEVMDSIHRRSDTGRVGRNHEGHPREQQNEKERSQPADRSVVVVFWFRVVGERWLQGSNGIGRGQQCPGW